MQSLFVFVTAAALSASVPALGAPPATVNFSSAQGLPFSLVLDGRVMTNPVARQVHIGQLAPGRHWAAFSLATPYGQPMSFRTTIWLEPGLETSYVLLMRPYGPQLQRVSAVPAYGLPGQPGGYGGTYQPPVAAQPQPGTYGGGPGDYAGSPNGYPPGVPNGGSPDGSYPAPTAPTYPGGNNYPAPTAPAYPDTNGYPAPAAPAYPDGSYDPNTAPTPAPDAQGPTAGSTLPPLPPAQVDALLQELHDHPADNARLSIAKQALAGNSVQAEELAQLLGTFTLDRARIALAEYGYEHLSDPQNFYVVYEVFHLPASVQQVQQDLGLPAQ